MSYILKIVRKFIVLNKSQLPLILFVYHINKLPNVVFNKCKILNVYFSISLWVGFKLNKLEPCDILLSKPIFAFLIFSLLI